MRNKLYKHPKLYEAFDLYCRLWCAEQPTEEELAEISVSPAFVEKMHRLFQRQKYGYYALFGTVGRRVASIVVALLVGMTVTTFSVKALRDPVVRFITEVFESFTSILFVNDEPAESDAGMKAVVPAYIPEGYEVEQQFSDGETVHRVTYYNKENQERVLYTQRWEDVSILNINTEGIEYHTVQVNGTTGIAYTQNESTVIMFVYGQYTFTVKGSLSEEELLRIAASIPLE